MSLENIFEQWEECGSKKLSEFTISDYYSIMFEDSDGTFDYIFEKIGITKEEVIQSEDPKVIDTFEQIDNHMKRTIPLFDNFIQNYLLKDLGSIQFVKDKIDVLDNGLNEVYNDVHNEMMYLKNYIEECDVEFEWSMTEPMRVH